jgi:hypothetical protein
MVGEPDPSDREEARHMDLSPLMATEFLPFPTKLMAEALQGRRAYSSDQS